MMEDMSNSDPELRHIFFKDANALRCAVAGHNHAAISHELCDVTCLPARRRARIEDFFSGLWTQKLARNHRAWVLNVAVASPDSACRQRVKFHKIRTTRQWPGCWIKPQKLVAVDF